MNVRSLKSVRRVALLLASVLVVQGIVVATSAPARAAGPADPELVGSGLLAANQSPLVYPHNSDGYYLMLMPLSRGRHEVSFGAAVEWDFDGTSEVAQDMTWHLTIP